MKKIMLGMSLGLLVSCGAIDALSDRCGNGTGCKFVFGKNDKDQQEQIDRNTSDIEKLRQALALLESKVDVLDSKSSLAETQISSIQSDLLDLEDNDADLQAQINIINGSLTSTINNVSSIQLSLTAALNSISALQSTDASLQAQIDNLLGRIEVLESADYQTQINNLVVNLANLSNEVEGSITRIWDPCGDHAGNFDEVILQTNDGTFMAYFESGSKRFLSVLGNGTYQTTDNQACVFNISGTNISPAVEL